MINIVDYHYHGKKGVIYKNLIDKITVLIKAQRFSNREALFLFAKRGRPVLAHRRRP